MNGIFFSDRSSYSDNVLLLMIRSNPFFYFHSAHWELMMILSMILLLLLFLLLLFLLFLLLSSERTSRVFLVFGYVWMFSLDWFSLSTCSILRAKYHVFDAASRAIGWWSPAATRFDNTTTSTASLITSNISTSFTKHLTWQILTSLIFSSELFESTRKSLVYVGPK